MGAKITVIHAKEYIADYGQDENIYPVKISRKLHIPVVDAYRLCEEGVDEGILTSCLEIFCPHCKTATGRIYRAFWELPETMECPNCKKQINNILAEHTIVIYRKIQGGSSS